MARGIVRVVGVPTPRRGTGRVRADMKCGLESLKGVQTRRGEVVSSVQDELEGLGEGRRTEKAGT